VSQLSAVLPNPNLQVKSCDDSRLIALSPTPLQGFGQTDGFSESDDFRAQSGTFYCTEGADKTLHLPVRYLDAIVAVARLHVPRRGAFAGAFTGVHQASSRRRLKRALPDREKPRQVSNGVLAGSSLNGGRGTHAVGIILTHAGKRRQAHRAAGRKFSAINTAS
jgi:hypothetical protein